MLNRMLMVFGFVALCFGLNTDSSVAASAPGDLLETPAPVPVVNEKECHNKCPNCCLSCGEDCYWVCADKDCKQPKKRMCVPKCNKCGSKYECGMDNTP